jgi:hypothetical protein
MLAYPDMQCACGLLLLMWLVKLLIVIDRKIQGEEIVQMYAPEFS